MEITEEVQALIAEKVEEATSGLKAKNSELLGKVKKLQQGATIDPADLEAAERDRDEWKGKAQAAERAAKKAVTDLEAATKRATDIDAAYANTLRDSALADALAKAGVTNPVHIKAAKALLKDAVQVVDENGTRVVKAGDVALDKHVSDWAGGDEGKHFVTAPDAGGGGSSPSGRTPITQPKGDSGGDKAARLTRAQELLAQHEE